MHFCCEDLREIILKIKLQYLTSNLTESKPLHSLFYNAALIGF